MRLLTIARVLLFALVVFYEIASAADQATQGRPSQQNKQTIKDRYGKLLGEIRPDASGRLEARDRFGRLLGRYDPVKNETRDPYGRLLTKGNTLSALIMKAVEAKSK